MNENDNINEIICSFCDGGKEKTISHSSDSKGEIINTNKTTMYTIAIIGHMIDSGCFSRVIFTNIPL